MLGPLVVRQDLPQPGVVVTAHRTFGFPGVLCRYGFVRMLAGGPEFGDCRARVPGEAVGSRREPQRGSKRKEKTPFPDANGLGRATSIANGISSSVCLRLRLLLRRRNRLGRRRLIVHPHLDSPSVAPR